MSDREARVRERAHQLWEQEGRPDGRHHDHWEQASREIDAEGVAVAEPAAPARKKALRARKSAQPAAVDSDLKPAGKKRSPKPA